MKFPIVFATLIFSFLFSNSQGEAQVRSMFFPPPFPVGGYTGWVEPQNGGKANYRTQFDATVPINKDFSIGVGSAMLHLENSPLLSGSGSAGPIDLWRVNASFQDTQFLEDKKTVSGFVSLGSASDYLFANAGVTTFTVGGLYGFSTSEQSRWMLGVFVSNISPIGAFIPLPGVTYVYTEKDLIVTAGIPINSVRWTFAPAWKFLASFAFFGPSINLELSHGEHTDVQPVLGASWTAEDFIPRDRVNTLDRIFYAEKRMYGGVRIPVVGPLNAEVLAGYVVDRVAFVQQNYFLSVTGNSEYQPNTFFAQASLRVGF